MFSAASNLRIYFVAIIGCGLSLRSSPVRRASALLRIVASVLLSSLSFASYSHSPAPAEYHAVEDNVQALEELRKRGDGLLQRRYAWKIIQQLIASQNPDSPPPFQSWRGEAQLFSTSAGTSARRGIWSFSRDGVRPASFAGDASLRALAPLFTYTLYNNAAYDHIVRLRLNDATELERLRLEGPLDEEFRGDRSVPEFPTDAIVLKTVWWPVASSGETALPIWDPSDNVAGERDSNYLTWKRIVAVRPTATVESDQRRPELEFAGQSYHDVRITGLDAFHAIKVDEQLAASAMRDSMTRKAVLIALGRLLKSGDYLILVGANLASRELRDWIWIAFWWHDQPDAAPYGSGRPPDLPAVWRNYLMTSTFDAIIPRARDQGPNICFNPWLEGRFPNADQGGGTVSNCLACHKRASYPAVAFLPVRRGAANPGQDEAFASGRLRTSFLWALPIHARP